jgi:hypothetical protein
MADFTQDPIAALQNLTTPQSFDCVWILWRPSKTALVLHLRHRKSRVSWGTTLGLTERWETCGNLWKSQKAITNRLLYH